MKNSAQMKNGRMPPSSGVAAASDICDVPFPRSPRAAPERGTNRRSPIHSLSLSPRSATGARVTSKFIVYANADIIVSNIRSADQ